MGDCLFHLDPDPSKNFSHQSYGRLESQSVCICLDLFQRSFRRLYDTGMLLLFGVTYVALPIEASQLR